MKGLAALILAACLCSRASSAEAAGTRRDQVRLVDGTMLYRVRFVCISAPVRSVYLVHRDGVCNMEPENFAPEILADVPVMIYVPSVAKTDSSRAVPEISSDDAELSKTVHVREYTKANGTHVDAYDRSAPQRRK